MISCRAEGRSPPRQNRRLRKKIYGKPAQITWLPDYPHETTGHDHVKQRLGQLLPLKDEKGHS